ncbi:MAG: response regulator transcription factor [Cyanobacteria bacterium P01_A01_bin.83]
MSLEKKPLDSSSQQSWQVLLVEDDPLMQLGLEQFFAKHAQYIVVGQASNGYQAVEMSLKLKPDLVIMDIGLPQMDGIEATKQIKTNLPDTAVIMLTSHRSQTETIASLASGADAYCLKSTSLKGLLTAIAAAKEQAVYLDPNVARQVVKQLQFTKTNDCDREASGRHRPIGQLSARELEVLHLIVDGKTNSEIADLLYLSLSTVKTNIRSIMNKLAVNDRVQVAVVALRSGLI